MIKIDPSFCLVLDLDDTLYSEKSYQQSGFLEIANYLELLFELSKESTLKILNEAVVLGNPIDYLCEQYGLNQNLKDSLIWVYRLHKPKIKLDSDIKNFILAAEDICPTIILTDGRSITQRLKLKALQLDYLPKYISDEYGSEKPSLEGFKKIMNEYQSLNYVYVGDNPKKDFYAPNKLNWFTVGFVGRWQSLYSQSEIAGAEWQPNFWINNLHDLLPVC